MEKVTAVFDIGKTNKKLLLFDAEFNVLCETITQFEEISDEYGYPCDNLSAICNWLDEQWRVLQEKDEFEILALNITTYGASLVHLGRSGEVMTELYNYLKPVPDGMMEIFYKAHGPSGKISLETCSPELHMLNSGIQLFWMKYWNSEVYNSIKYSLHFPNYLSYRFTGNPVADFSSLGCHTMMWDFGRMDYHSWMKKEGTIFKLGRLTGEPVTGQTKFRGKDIPVGCGLHDSTAALQPYIGMSEKPFILLSTGTWSVAMNPYNAEPLTLAELQKDCLCFLRPDEKQIKAARLHLGREHDDAVRGMAGGKESGEYEALNLRLAEKQAGPIWLVAGRTPVRRVIVTGGFSRNELFIKALQQIMPEFTFECSGFAEASALGAAMQIRKW